MSRILTPDQSIRLQSILRQLSELAGEAADDGVIIHINRDFDDCDPALRCVYRASVQLNERVEIGDDA